MLVNSAVHCVLALCESSKVCVDQPLNCKSYQLRKMQDLSLDTTVRGYCWKTRLLAIDFTAFRTWAGTMIAYHSNGNLLKVKQLLGHKQIKNSMRYIGKINFQSQDFETTSATTVEDILRLGKEGWIEYSVVKINNVEYHCFRKPKRFSSYV